MTKKHFNTSGLVYSTDPNYKIEDTNEAETSFIEPAQQLIKVKLETKHRAGKAVTLVDNFSGSNEQKEELGKKLKTFCGTGGSVKDGEIIVQGDHREKVVQWLHKNGYTKARRI